MGIRFRSPIVFAKKDRLEQTRDEQIAWCMALAIVSMREGREAAWVAMDKLPDNIHAMIPSRIEAIDYQCALGNKAKEFHDNISEAYKTLDDMQALKPTAPPPLHEASDSCDETMQELKDTVERLRSTYLPTAKDLMQPMRDKMEQEDPSLGGDLALILHQLRDPQNHPVSLINLAEQIAGGEIQNPKAAAMALDRMVTEFRENIPPRASFQMSDEAVLRAMDQARGTLC